MNRFLCAGLLTLGSVTAGGVNAQATSPAPKSAAPKSTVLRWGALSVTTLPRDFGNEQAGEQSSTVTVRNGARTVLTVRGWNTEARLVPLRPGGTPELVVNEFSGGAHCCTTAYLFTQDEGRVENIGILDAGDAEPEFRDLNGDGTQEIVYASNALAYFDWSFADSPFPRTVLGWDGVRIADRTRAYAYVPGQAAARELAELRKLMSGQGEGLARARLGGYYVNMILAGRGAEAEATLRRDIFPKSPDLKRWFAANRTALVNASYAEPEGRLQAVNSAEYPLRDPAK